jgi:hypothetical protein
MIHSPCPAETGEARGMDDPHAPAFGLSVEGNILIRQVCYSLS